MRILSFFISIGFIASSFSCADSSAKINMQTNSADGFAVVELFTSEGCSSCPPADNAVATLLQKYNSNVYVLGYHVDYWDNLGWKDIFSNAAYTQLQRAYARSFKLSSVYTPQIVVNGTEQFVGSDEKKLNNSIKKCLQQPPTSKLHIDAKAGDDHEIKVQYSTGAPGATLHIALVQFSADNKIQRGENTGATLHHVNIVRDIKTVSTPLTGVAVLKLPGNLKVTECTIIAFMQNISDNKITAATGTGIQ